MTPRPVVALHSWLVVGALVLAAVAHGAEPVSVAGQLLVATEQIGDPRFHHTVIYMVSHDATGALGVIVNRPPTPLLFGLLPPVHRPLLSQLLTVYLSIVKFAGLFVME